MQPGLTAKPQERRFLWLNRHLCRNRKATETMVARISPSANNDLSWPALTSKREFLRGSDGIGLHVASWIAEELGYVVISMWPIARFGKKQPLEKWKELEFRTPLEIRRESKFRMRCGVGILAGKSKLVTIDIDNEESWIEFCSGREVPRTMALNTPNGRHLVFHDETGIAYKTQASGELATGVDVRRRGGLFVVYDPGQPERHFTDLTSPAELPDWLRAAIPLAGTRGHLKSKNGRRSQVSQTDIKKLASTVIAPGQHHEWLRGTALSLVNKGFTAANRNDWFLIASGALQRSNEGSDAKGNVDREKFSDEDIMSYFETALEIVANEDKDLRENPGKKYAGADIIQSAADVPDEDVDWIWSCYLPIGALTQLDGEKGFAKSFVLADLTARATRGLPMPGEEEAICDPMNVFIFTEELLPQSKKKLRAAGADLSRVFYPHPEFREAILRMMEKRHGVSGAMEKIEESDLEILLPSGIDLILEMISKADAGLVIWDPISHYVDPEKMNTNSDPAVRRALEPLVRGLDRMGAAGITVRHMNKDEKASAKNRGLGTTAFQNIGRVHLVMGRLSDENIDCGTFGLAMVNTNYTVHVRGTLTFDVVDSEVKLDKIGHYVGKIEWHDLEEDIDPNALVRGNDGRKHDGSGKPGPAPEKRVEVKRILIEMGEIKTEWDSVEAREYIRAEMQKRGHESVNDRIIDRGVRESLISSKKQPDSRNNWIWPAQRAPRAREA